MHCEARPLVGDTHSPTFSFSAIDRWGEAWSSVALCTVIGTFGITHERAWLMKRCPVEEGKYLDGIARVCVDGRWVDQVLSMIPQRQESGRFQPVMTLLLPGALRPRLCSGVPLTGIVFSCRRHMYHRSVYFSVTVARSAGSRESSTGRGTSPHP